jgi:hypothetical protein|tara:strand:+ start:235 stop:417 length:183 start_codon:yes stop_codon:yes gene_type:complete
MVEKIDFKEDLREVISLPWLEIWMAEFPKSQIGPIKLGENRNNPKNRIGLISGYPLGALR